MKEIIVDFDAVFVAQGTTATSCGLLLGLNEKQKLYAVPVLKGFDAVKEMNTLFQYSGIDQEWLEDAFDRLNVLSEAHFGGYGKYTTELLEFIQLFYKNHRVKLDPVDTGKAMWAMMKELENEKWNGKTVVFIHTGGIQGIPSIEEKSGMRLFD